VRLARFALALAVLVLVPSFARGETRTAGDKPAAAALPRLRVAAVGSLPGTAPAELASALERAGPFDVRSADPARPENLDSALVEWADVLVIASLPEEPGQALRLAVEANASAKGLVFCGEAATAWPDSAGFGALLARSRVLAGEPSTAVPLVVAVLDQQHAVTQCVTHFRHSGRPRFVEVAKSARVLARAVAAGERRDAAPPAVFPALWIVDGSAPAAGGSRRGRIVVSTLDSTGPSADLVRALLARAAEWAGGRGVSVRLSGDFELLAEGLGPDDAKGLPESLDAKGFFRGRQFAPVMSFHGADWLLRPDREATEQPDRVVEALAIGAGQTVADIGCGNGYFSLRVARKVGETGKVLASDIQKEMFELLEKRAKEAGAANIVPLLATETDPKLPPGEVDLALMVDVYHELARPEEVLAAVRKSLKKDGRLVLVEYRGEDPAIAIKPLHRTTEKQIRAELRVHGFRFLENKDFLPYQHVLVFGAD
jgi:SAM-dependent methyltransferase